MKHLAHALLLMLIFCVSCNSVDLDEMVEEKQKRSNDYHSKDITLPLNPCDYISRSMILSRFKVTSEELELKEENVYINTNNNYSKCGYTWKKSNYEELQNRLSEAMLDYATQREVKKGMNNEMEFSKINQLESPNNSVQIGYFKEYKNSNQAKKDFENAHKVPSAKEIKMVYREFDKKSIQSKRIGHALSSDLVNNMKFTRVDKVGDAAFYDHLNQSLNVRFGTISFSVFIESESGFDTNIQLAKELALEVWNKL